MLAFGFVGAAKADPLMAPDSGFTHRQTMAGAVRFNALALSGVCAALSGVAGVCMALSYTLAAVTAFVMVFAREQMASWPA